MFFEIHGALVGGNELLLDPIDSSFNSRRGVLLFVRHFFRGLVDLFFLGADPGLGLRFGGLRVDGSAGTLGHRKCRNKRNSHHGQGRHTNKHLVALAIP